VASPPLPPASRSHEPPEDDAPWPEPEDEYSPPWDEPTPESTTPAPRRVVAVPVREALASKRAEAGEHAPEPRVAVNLQTTPEGDFWHDTVQALIEAEAITALVRELGLQSQLVAREADHWRLRVEIASLNQPGARDRLVAALATVGHTVRLSVEQGPVTDSPAKRLQALAQRRQAQAEEVILGDPFVQEVMRDFGGRIVPGTLKATPA
jgi:DNA polymerase-3 subunit gamma/tau